MSAVSHRAKEPSVAELGAHGSDARRRAADGAAYPAAFAATALRYLGGVLPYARRELAHWQRRARLIHDPALQRTALESLDKRGNIEGAALFATLAAHAHRRAATRALVAFQTAYNMLDALSELPATGPAANAERLHRALLAALQPGTEHEDYYAYGPRQDDGGYLRAIIESCRMALRALPSFEAVAADAIAAAARIVEFQTLNHLVLDGGPAALQTWAAGLEPETGLAWWEAAGAAGSSLSVHALIAAAADPRMDAGRAAALDAVYFPWQGALHSLLDSLVDRAEDAAAGQLSLIGCYGTPASSSARLGWLAERAREACEDAPDGRTHRVILTAMCSYYLSAPESGRDDAGAVRRELEQILGPSLPIAIAMFRARRAAHGLAGGSYA